MIYMQTGSLVVSLHCFSLGLLTSTLLSLLLSSHCQSLWWTKCLIFTFGIHIFNFVFVSMCGCDLNYLLLLPIHRTCVCSSKIRILKKVTSLITPKIKYRILSKSCPPNQPADKAEQKILLITTKVQESKKRGYFGELKHPFTSS